MLHDDVSIRGTECVSTSAFPKLRSTTAKFCPARVNKQLGHSLGCIPFATQLCAVPASKRLPATMLERGAGRKQGPLSLAPHRHEGRKLEQDRHCTYNNIEGRSYNHCCRRKAISITHSECVSIALGIGHAMRMRDVVILWPVRLYNIFFSTLTHKRHNFLKKKYRTQNVCFDCLYKFVSETVLILRRNVRDMINNVHGIHVKYALF